MRVVYTRQATEDFESIFTFIADPDQALAHV